jgi:hypothetical protein
MPRKLRIPKARRGDALHVSRAVFLWLTWGDWTAAFEQAQADDEGMRELFFDAKSRQTRRYWVAIEDEALAAWTAVYPGTRPPAWWFYSQPEPELRQLIGGVYRIIPGAERCHPTGIAYIDDWKDDPPLVESQPAYLDRLRLWLPKERAQVDREAFASQPFSYSLTVAPRGVPEDDDDGGELVDA